MSHPQQPYGEQPPHGYQHQPQQPYGYGHPSGQQGYGYPPPPPPPKPPKSNTGVILIVVLAVVVLLGGGCAAVVIALGSASDSVVTQPDAGTPFSLAPTAAEQPAADEPSQQQQPSTVGVGQAIDLEGTDPGLRVKVTLAKVIPSATSDNQFMKPKAGNRHVGVELTLSNVGTAVYSDSPTNGAHLIDSEGQQYNATFGEIREGKVFGGTVTMSGSDTRKGVILFEVPEGAKLAKFQFALNSGFAKQKGEWVLS